MSGPEIPKPERLDGIREFLSSILGKSLEDEIPTAEESAELCERLNYSLAWVMGKKAVIDSGVVYWVGDGQIMGSHVITGRDIGDHFNTGIKNDGILKRFDVLEIRDELITRGTKMVVPEPCLVFEETPHVVHRAPEPEISEAYVPLLRLGEFKIASDDFQPPA